MGRHLDFLCLQAGPPLRCRQTAGQRSFVCPDLGEQSHVVIIHIGAYTCSNLALALGNVPIIEMEEGNSNTGVKLELRPSRVKVHLLHR